MEKETIINFAKENKVNLSVTWWDDEIWLNRIIVPKSKRCQGLGGKIINMLKQYVDDKHIPLKLLADSCYGTEINALKNVYRKFGFEEYKEGKKKSNNYMAYNLEKKDDKK